MGRKDGAGRSADLSGVAPERRETIRRRIAALDEYEAHPARTIEVAAKLAGGLGISVPSFYRLWRSWRSLRDPAALGGAQTTRRGRAVRDDVAFVRSVLAVSEPAGSHESKTLEVEREAARLGVAVRSRSALRRLVRDIREEGTRPPLAVLPASVVAFDMVAIELPVTVDGSTTLPVAAAVIHPYSGAILAASLSVDEPSPALAATALLRWVRSVDPDATGTVVQALMLPTTPHDEWTGLRKAFGRVGVGLFGPSSERLPAGSVAADALGRHLLGFEIRQEMAKRRAADRRPRPRSYRLGGPPSLREAQTAIDERIAAAFRPEISVPKPTLLVETLDAFVRRSARSGGEAGEHAVQPIGDEPG